MQWDPANNPYNFITFGPPVKFPQGPPSHRRYHGLSGTIELELTNETPMLVAQRVNPPEEIPPRLENFKINGQPAIPGTSLKGMVRSVLEALTNSCFVIFNGEPLDYRLATQDALNLRPGRVTRLPTENQPGQVEEMERAWIAMPGKPAALKIRHKGREKTITLASAPTGARSGQTVWIKGLDAEAYFSPTRQARGRPPWIKPATGKFPVVTDISLSPKKGYLEGVFKITGQSIDNKKRERVFAPKNPPVTFEFSLEEMENYNRILQGQLAEHDKRGDFELTETEPLQVGSLIYFKPQGNRATLLSRVEIPRTTYRHSRADRLPSAYHKCTNPENLCTACRLFGFIADLYGACGRISFTDATWQNGPGELEDFFPLRVLGEPHPTSCNFYLLDPGNPSQVRNYDGLKITDGRGRTEGPAGQVRLRGRKFYHHHKPKPWPDYRCPDPQKFRRVINEVRPLKPGNAFTFRVHFRNLSETELGLLLYGLLLEEPWRHKLGLAKSLGLGTVKITCRSLKVSPGGQRYHSYGAQVPDRTMEISRYLGAMKEAVKAATGQDFHQLINVDKLGKILDPARAPAAPGYPFDPTGREEGFAWYARNKNRALPEL
ncbi:MAG: TIGR03986 family CRISPR-associated RAMP protein [Deltaproteobacteria bacterium]|nr:TIGR03986 family CRISPR-associated RAMP protein [Deltaproteobacteria bacterium]